MNVGTVAILGVLVVSIVVAGVVVYHINLPSDFNSMVREPVQYQSSLNEDLKDILAFIPLDEVRSTVEAFIEHDRQIGDITIHHINDEGKHIAREFKNLKRFQDFVTSASNRGLDVDFWSRKVQELWENKPAYVKADDTIACGGLSVLFNRIMKTIPKEELHELLRQKVKHSGSFRAFIQEIRSDSFQELCKVIVDNHALQRQYFWAVEADIEVAYALELLEDLYVYLTEDLS